MAEDPLARIHREAIEYAQRNIEERNRLAQLAILQEQRRAEAAARIKKERGDKSSNQ